ncbi:hypothetical protein EKH57_13570 [Halorubrum sp. BOL3-1]|uniref:DNA replication complex subunit Gins51 n=1 Tax=Halorubrum sp. BOL3-1 TaxID=2497325 RepID=UPI0010050F08|nr:hypothetical protein [Halorubrum sp. BOL3-1]QAU13662.1 hypothetical protein EKH57_13570 [Halorubrum sp. BOL3-1]
MNLDELRSAQAKERRKDSLQHLRDSFYDDVGAYVADLRAARDRRAEQVESPFEDDDIRRLSDEVETAEEVAEALYERRVGKVVKLASFAAADMSVDEEGMTTEERRLFDDLVERITANKSQVLDVLAGESPVSDGTPISDESPVSNDSIEAAEPAETDRTPEAGDALPTADAEATGSEQTEATGSEQTESPPTDPGALAGAMGGDDAESTSDASPEPSGRDAAPSAGSDGAGGETSSGATTDGGAVPEAKTGGEPDAGPEPAESTDRATVRITRDIGAIFGVDEREYELASEDVVSLPVENADPLVQRDAAERID